METVEGLPGKSLLSISELHFLILLAKASHLALKVDVSDEKSVKELADLIMSKYAQPPNVVIHAAGILIPNRQSIFDISHCDWNRMISVNLTGTFLINQTFGRLMRDKSIKNGTIVNFASKAAKMSQPKIADYCASKSGVISLTQNFAHELAPFQIRVNAVAPGAIETPMLGPLSDESYKKIVSRIPQGRFGTADEVARLCLFLASTESSHITGQTVYITGGL